MQIKLVFLSLILLFCNLAFGVNLMKYEVFDSSAGVDIALSFDSQYNPTVFQDEENNNVIITLKDVISDEKHTNQLNSKIINEFSIIPLDNSTQIIFYRAQNIKIQALASKDNLSLTLRITNPAFAQLKIEEPKEQINTEKSKEVAPFSFRKYIGFIVGALILLAILLFAKLFFRKKRDRSLENFFDNNECVYDPVSKSTPPPLSQNIQVVFQKQLDSENRVVMLKFEHKKYLVLIGASNLLLDQFGEEFIHCEEDFQEFFNKNQKSLCEFIQKNQSSLKNYIEKASKY